VSAGLTCVGFVTAYVVWGLSFGCVSVLQCADVGGMQSVSGLMGAFRILWTVWLLCKRTGCVVVARSCFTRC
jgi:hypothetical protein